MKRDEIGNSLHLYQIKKMVIKSPESISENGKNVFSVFLAGSIEMGTAINWQKQIELAFEGRKDVMLFNPRRDDWDSSWKQEIDNPKFKEQVDWELNALNAADLIIMYFAPETQSPVTLLELGLFADSKKLVVCCPSGFLRKGNVDIVCDRYNIPQVNKIDQLITYIRQNIQST